MNHRLANPVRERPTTVQIRVTVSEGVEAAKVLAAHIGGLSRAHYLATIVDAERLAVGAAQRRSADIHWWHSFKPEDSVHGATRRRRGVGCQTGIGMKLGSPCGEGSTRARSITR